MQRHVRGYQARQSVYHQRTAASTMQRHFRGTSSMVLHEAAVNEEESRLLRCIDLETEMQRRDAVQFRARGMQARAGVHLYFMWSEEENRAAEKIQVRKVKQARLDDL